MEIYWKVISLVLVAVVLWMVVDRQQKELGILLTLAVSCTVATAALSFLSPLLDLVWQLKNLGNLQEGIVNTLLKAVGVGFVSETAGRVCQDAGNGSMANLIRMFGTTGIMYVSIPVFQSLIGLIQEILGVL